MATKLPILTHKIAIQLHLVAESSTFCSSRSWRPVRILLVTPSYSVTLDLMKVLFVGLFSKQYKIAWSSLHMSWLCQTHIYNVAKEKEVDSIMIVHLRKLFVGHLP